ncbi:unnamed protein product [Adineta steineri]|uniref:Uncharacterized protein n=1 Tax=Adineta steineri TaxID=433720 RepID=A0A813PHH1_9BILA|nr:unnamed protein product [Adineta steineri]CAF0740735.1 unnamed protein product [Adineta steineri]CAF0750702.1 unnamed protein product [Adineta steineri]
MTTANTQGYYPTMQNQDDSLFYDDQIQRFDADTIKNRYGSNWKNFATNVREITQPDGSIVKEYIIDDPSLLEEINTSSHHIDSISSPTASDDDQQSIKNRFAQIKAKFEQKNTSNVMASPSTSSANSSSTTSRHSRKQIDDLYARHRQTSNESMSNNDTNRNSANTLNQSLESQNTYRRSQSIGSEQSTGTSYRRFDSVDEADEEVRRIHRQGEELRRHQQQDLTSVSSIKEGSQPKNRIQYEIVDENGNPMAVDGVQDLIKMSGARAREVPQPDGSIIKEYVIDDPQLLSRFRSENHQQQQQHHQQLQQQQQQQQQYHSPITAFNQQRSSNENVPPPPPRVPLRPSVLLRQGNSSVNENAPSNIQQIRVLESQRRYEYRTTTGRRVQFFITNFDTTNGQSITDSEVRELANAINNRLIPTTTPPASSSSNTIPQQTQYNLPKQWYPSIDVTQRQRLGSDTQTYPNNMNLGFPQTQSNLARSASYGALNQTSYPTQNHQQQIYREPTNNWNTNRYQQNLNPRINQQNQDNEAFQTSAQFLPKQQTNSSSPINPNHPPVYYQQSTAYPYQGQQQHGVRILNDFNQQRTTSIADGHTRI